MGKLIDPAFFHHLIKVLLPLERLRAFDSATRDLLVRVRT